MPCPPIFLLISISVYILSSVFSDIRHKKQCRDTVGATSPSITWFSVQSLENMTPSGNHPNMLAKLPCQTTQFSTWSWKWNSKTPQLLDTGCYVPSITWFSKQSLENMTPSGEWGACPPLWRIENMTILWRMENKWPPPAPQNHETYAVQPACQTTKVRLPHGTSHNNKNSRGARERSFPDRWLDVARHGARPLQRLLRAGPDDVHPPQSEPPDRRRLVRGHQLVVNPGHKKGLSIVFQGSAKQSRTSQFCGYKYLRLNPNMDNPNSQIYNSKSSGNCISTSTMLFCSLIRNSILLNFTWYCLFRLSGTHLYLFACLKCQFLKQLGNELMRLASSCEWFFWEDFGPFVSFHSQVQQLRMVALTSQCLRNWPVDIARSFRARQTHPASTDSTAQWNMRWPCVTKSASPWAQPGLSKKKRSLCVAFVTTYQ